MGTSILRRLVKLLICALVVTFIFFDLPSISAQEQSPDLVLTKIAEAQLDDLASRVAQTIKTNNRGKNPPKVLVFDFTMGSPDVSSLLGTRLADRFSEMLKIANSGVEVADRKLLIEYFKDTWTSIEDLKSNLACLQIAEDLGASEIIRANLVEDATQQLNVLVQVAGPEPSFSDQARFLITSDMEAIASRPSPSYVKAPDTIPPEPGVILLGSKSIDGVSSPQCITCPDPKYSQAARAEKASGTVVLSAVVTTAGEVTSVYVLKGAPLGLTQRAIETAKAWKLKPAMKNGQPVAARVDITLTFRLL